MTTKAVKKTTKKVAKKVSKKTTKKTIVPKPTHHEISEKALEIYHNRLAKKIKGSAESDWYAAIKSFK